MAHSTTPTAPTPTGAQAIAYVRAHFATVDFLDLSWGNHATVCGVLPCPHSAQARDVLFILGADPKPARMTVWFEPTGPNSYALYGEY